MSSKSFYALEVRWWMVSSLYKLIVTSSAVCGARIGTALYHAQVIDEIGLESGPFLPFVRRWLLTKRSNLEERYRGLDPLGADFLLLDARNFRFFRDDVAEIALTSPWWIWYSKWRYNGEALLEFRLRDGSLRKFIVVGKIRVRDHLRSLFPVHES